MTTTRYEIIAIKGDKRHVVAYTARRTLACLRTNAWMNAEEIIKAIDADEKGTIVSQSVEGGILFTDGAKVMFSGQTELGAKHARLLGLVA